MYTRQHDIKKNNNKKIKVILSCCMHLMHPLDKPGWWTGEGKSQADASVWLLQGLTCSIPHTGSQQRAETCGSIWQIGTAGHRLEVVVNILALDFSIPAWIAKCCYYSGRKCSHAHGYRKQTHTIFHIIHHLMQHFPRIAVIVLLTLHC